MCLTNVEKRTCGPPVAKVEKTCRMSVCGSDAEAMARSATVDPRAVYGYATLDEGGTVVYGLPFQVPFGR